MSGSGDPRPIVYALAGVMMLIGLILVSAWGLLLMAAGAFVFRSADPGMAFDCPHCGGWVASYRTICLHCGRDIPTQRRR